MILKYQSQYGPVQVELAEQNLVMTHPGGRVEVPYHQLTAMTLSDQLYLSQQGSVLAIPREAFADQNHLYAFGHALIAKNPNLAPAAAQAPPAAPSGHQVAAYGLGAAEAAAKEDADEEDREQAEAEAWLRKRMRPDGKPGCLLLFLSMVSLVKALTIGRFRALRDPDGDEEEDPFAVAVPVSDARSLYEASQRAGDDDSLWAYTEVQGLTGDRRCLVSYHFFDGVKSLSREQLAAYEYMRQNFARLKPMIIQAMMDMNQEMRTQHREHMKGQNMAVQAMMKGLEPPDVKSTAKFEKLLRVPRWELRPEHKDGLGYVAVCYDPSWTVHTEGVVLQGDNIIFVGKDPDFTSL